jgi:hypothetical protein
MKNISKIGLSTLLISVFALAGCGIKKAANTENPVQNSSAGNSNPSVAEKMKQSLFDLVTTGTGVKCAIEDPKMGPITMFAKGDKAKVEGFSFMSMANISNPMENSQPAKEEKGTMINDGTWAYMWSGKKGMKFNIKEMEALTPKGQNQNEDKPQSNASDWKDWVKGMDEKGTKYDCSPTVLSDSDFAPPGDVQFDDWGEMMKGFVKMGEDLKNKMPDQAIPSTP